MTTRNRLEPPPFSYEDFAARMRRVVSSAAEKGLAGVIVTPGPDWSGSPDTSQRRSLSG
jgi:hypothetical protein